MSQPLCFYNGYPCQTSPNRAAVPYTPSGDCDRFRTLHDLWSVRWPRRVWIGGTAIRSAASTRSTAIPASRHCENLRRAFCERPAQRHDAQNAAGGNRHRVASRLSAQASQIKRGGAGGPLTSKCGSCEIRVSCTITTAFFKRPHSLPTERMSDGQLRSRPDRHFNHALGLTVYCWAHSARSIRLIS